MYFEDADVFLNLFTTLSNIHEDETACETVRIIHSDCLCDDVCFLVWLCFYLGLSG